MKRLRKVALLFIATIFLLVGAAAALLFAIQRDTDPGVTADINAHFASLETLPIMDTSIDIPIRKAADSDNPPLFTRNAAQNVERIDPGRKESRARKQGFQKLQMHRRQDQSRTGETDIREIAPGTWLISRNTYAHARKHMTSYVGNARAELVENGNGNGPLGFRLKNIKKNSALHRIGLRSNDILIAINGFPLNSVENVTLAIASFKKASQFRLDLLRKDNKRSFYYKIAD
jgi:sarcosine oxidase gamma subunit